MESATPSHVQDNGLSWLQAHSNLVMCFALTCLSFVAVVRSVKLSSCPDRVLNQSLLGHMKLGFGAIYAVSSTCALAVLLFQIQTLNDGLISFVYSLCFASWCFWLASRMEHCKTIRPSHFLQCFVLVLVTYEVLWFRKLDIYNNIALRASAYTHAIVLAILTIVESCGKRNLFVSEADQRLSQEETSSLVARRFFWYLNGFLRKAYRNTVSLSDLPRVDTRLFTEDATTRFQRHWSQRRNQSRQHALLLSLCAALWKNLCIPMVPRLLALTMMLGQPFLISTILAYVQDADQRSLAMDFQMLAAFSLNFISLAIFSSWYSHGVAQFAVELRSILISSIYAKALRTKGQEVDFGSATVLMNVDMEKVLEGMKYVHEIWAVPTGLFACLYILYQSLGVAFVVPLIILLLAMVLSWDLGENMRLRNLEWVTKTEKRVTTLAKIAASLKEARMLGLTDVLHKTMMALRVDELIAYRSTASLWIFVVGFGVGMFPVLIFATFALVGVTSLKGGRVLDYSALFTSLSVLKLTAALTLPMLQQIITFQGAIASLDRMQAYLVEEGEELGTIRKNDALSGHDERQAPGDLDLPDPDGFELQETFSKSRPTIAFEMANASFGFHQGQSLLHHMTLRIEQGSFTMIIGKVGCGKSLVLQSILGELTTLDGSFKRGHSDASFCSQPTWLRNVSVRENILGESAFDESWYSTVLWACGLEQDMNELPNGDATSVGSSGMSLSGGQKNRVSLARAIYARKPIVIIDDILSGLDNSTEKLVFSRVFGQKGLLRQMKCTTLLATHSVHWTAHSDKIVVMSEGCIIANGHYQTLMQTPELWETYCLPDSEVDPSTHNVAVQESSNEGERKESHTPEPETKVESGDYKRKGESGTLLYYLKGVGKTRMAIYLFLMIATYSVNAIQYVWVKKLLTDSTSVVLFCRSISIFIGISLLAFFFIGTFLVYFFLILCPRSGLGLHARQLTVFMRAHFAAIVTMDVGEITNLFSQDTIIVDRLLPILWLNISTGILEQTKNCIILTAATPLIAAIIPFLVATGYVVQHFYLRTSRQLRHLDLEAKSPLCTNFIETLAGNVTIRAFGWSEAFKRRNRQLQNSSQVAYYLLQETQNWLAMVLDLIVAAVVTILVGLALVHRSGTDSGYLALALIGAMDLSFSIRVLVLAWTEVETAMSAVTRIRRFLDNTGQEPITYSDHTNPFWPTHGAVHFRGVSAAYSSDPSAPAAIRNVDLNIAAGEKIGICGRTGSGKSSLVATLFGLTHQTSGEILIDGVSTATVPLHTLRTRIITLTQEPFFLGKDVRTNLVLMPEERGPSDQDMIKALQKCDIWEKLAAAAAVAKGSSGLDVNLEDVSKLLSEGEKQLFCLARAMLNLGRIVILDEATSRVDATTDALMQKILRTEFADRTIIAISHRLTAIMDFDRVAVMDHGEIAELDSPRALMAREGGLFLTLVNAQVSKGVESLL